MPFQPGYVMSAQHKERIAASKRGRARSPETIEKMRASVRRRFGAANHNFRPVEERFWEKVAKRSPNECWEWTGSRDQCGYGMFQYAPRDCRRAHRVAWEFAHGPIERGGFVLHSCDNPPCVNLAHLSIGSNADNMRDMWTRQRRPRTWKKRSPVISEPQ